MKIGLAQLNYHIGNFEDNVAKVKAAIKKGKQYDADLIIFSELSICGYPARDFLEFNDFIDSCYNAIETIAKECNGISAIVGAPCKNPSTQGKKLLNSAFFLSNGKIQSTHHKGLLPTYDIFDEYRYFEPASNFTIATCNDYKLAITICEDIWNIGDDTLYKSCPMDQLSKENPDLLINISASPFDYNHGKDRLSICKKNATKYKLPLFLVNHVGAQTELVFDGGSLAMNSNGEPVDQLPYFKEDIRFYNWRPETGSIKIDDPTSQIKSNNDAYSKTELIHNALILGIKDYFRKSNLKKAILGLSGGIDSAVTLAIACSALGKENVRAILMPSKFSSDHSITDAEKLAINLGCSYDIIAINEVTDCFEKTLAPYFKNKPFDVAEENLQARSRGVILMGLSNKFGYVLFNTSNKSETAVGYGTLYGDMAGGLSVLGDVYKTEVYALARSININKEIIPQHIIDKPPSAELRPDQKDSDSLPDYETLDKILEQYIELKKGPNEIIKLGFDPKTTRRILKMVNNNEYKRYQTPPIIRISPKAFGMGRRMPIVGKYLT